MKKMRIKDIAKMANVSTATVSRVLNGVPNGVGDELRERVQQIIETTGYKPNLLAKSMVTNRHYTIGLMSSHIMAPFFEEVFQGINNCLRESGYNLLLCNSEEKDDYVAQVEALISRGIDGLILVGFYTDITKNLSHYLGSIPAVLFGHSPQQHPITQINTNNEQLSYEMTKLLIEQGHRQIGVITGPLRFGSVQERLSGYRRALLEQGLVYREDIVLTGDFTIESSSAPTRRLLQTDVTAIFCFNDLMAYGAYKICRQLGVDIPGAVSIAGFDELPYSELMTPPLTTACQPKYQMGYEGSRLLLDQISGKNTDKSVLTLDGKVIVRESVGPAFLRDAAPVKCKEEE